MVALSWTAPASGMVDHYRYCLTTTPSCTPSIQVVSTMTSVTVTALITATACYWQARACANSVCDIFTDADGSGGHWSFTVASTPGTFSKRAPVQGQTASHLAG